MISESKGVDGEEIYRIALGSRPDPWQRTLMERPWPSVLIAPTGSGKTAAVTLGWAARRLQAAAVTPRRLVWCLPMRTLVEQTANSVREWMDKLSSEIRSQGVLPERNDVHVLMGGVDGGKWLERPERPAVIVGTQDMLLSRALMRGYASSRANWPMEFAILHDDTQWVFDEVQLMGAGRATSTQIEAFRCSEEARAAPGWRTPGRRVHSLWISATLEPEWLVTVDHPKHEESEVMRVTPDQNAGDRLARLVHAKKAVHCSDVAPPRSAKAGDIESYIKDLAKAVRAAHRSGHKTLVIVNRVKRAQDLYRCLQKSDAPADLALVHSRFRAVDRTREMDKLTDPRTRDMIVVATQAVEAGIDFSSAVLFTELAPWSSMVQRFGRANRYAEYDDGAEVHWVDLLEDNETDEKTKRELALPYQIEELQAARERLVSLTDAAPVHLPPADPIDPPLHVIRRKDLDDLFDTDPDLTGFDVDVSPYVRDAEDTDVRVFWRDISDAVDEPPGPPRAEELCTAPIGLAKDWLTKVRKEKSNKTKGVLVYVRDPQARHVDATTGRANLNGWQPFRDAPWPGVTLLVDVRAGGYSADVGFTGDPGSRVDGISVMTDSARVTGDPAEDEEGHDDDPRSAVGVAVPLTDHLCHVATEAAALCDALAVEPQTRDAIVRAARWHDLGKAHAVFQDTMRRGLGPQGPGEQLLAKTVKGNVRHTRPYFRHELASALAFLEQEVWSRDADLVAYLVAAHHGKVRMNLRALPRERPPQGERDTIRFARGVWEGDEIPPVDLGTGECWGGGPLRLSVMEIGWDETTGESWIERTRELLARFGPFRLAWMETIVRLADWRASAKEREGRYGHA